MGFPPFIEKNSLLRGVLKQEKKRTRAPLDPGAFPPPLMLHLAVCLLDRIGIDTQLRAQRPYRWQRLVRLQISHRNLPAQLLQQLLIYRSPAPRINHEQIRFPSFP